jgi:hypothetical protein
MFSLLSPVVEAIQPPRITLLADPPLARVQPEPLCGNAPNFGQAGVIAQLGERFNGIEEVGGSIPPGSTSVFNVLR